MTMMTKNLRVSVCKIAKLNVLKDGKMGMNGDMGRRRAACITLALKYTNGR